MQPPTHFSFAAVLLSLAGVALADASAKPTPAKSPAKPEPIITRLFFQDGDPNTLCWADIRGGKTPVLEAVGTVAGFPTLDERQGLVQMQATGDYLLVDVRDDSEGSFGSGWVLIGTGVEEEAHGDHSHWRYQSPPAVRETKIDTDQGNPAHLYKYDGVFYLANDKIDGYTRLDPAAVPETGDVPTGFHQGGGGHVTLAVANGVGYGTWIDHEGPNAGRVDVTFIRPEGNAEIASSFTLPSGGIHGATAAAGKVFFAPSDGICWVAGTLPSAALEGHDVHHISLGTDPATERPRRTGAFAVHREHVLFVTGSGEDARLGLLDARASEPSLMTVKLPGAAGTKPVTPACIRTGRGKQYTLVAHDAVASEEGEDESSRPAETLTVIDLDPNGDGDFTDVAVAKSLPLGRSDVAGHGGHHAVAFDADGRRAFVTNPGDGTITFLLLATLKPLATFDVGGKPESIIAVGGRASAH